MEKSDSDSARQLIGSPQPVNEQMAAHHSHQGKVYVIGIGPGLENQMTIYAREIIGQCDVIIGYDTYVDLIVHLLKPSQEVVRAAMTEEVYRAQKALELASEGKIVGVISSGDAGLYGMAGLIFEVLHKMEFTHKVDVHVIPGVTALISAASLLGAPVMHDFCAISMSDHLTPWDTIEERLNYAALADFVIALYNPKSRRRKEQIERAREILLKHRSPENSVGIVTSAYRPDQTIVITDIEHMLDFPMGMMTTILIGNSQTYVIDGKMITPRGYEKKYQLNKNEQELKHSERMTETNEPWAFKNSLKNQQPDITVAPARFVLFIGHGSRDERGNDEIRTFVQNLVQKKKMINTEVCFLEFGAPDISSGIDNCVNAGASEVIVIPVILLPAGHSKLHIPSALDQAQEKYPHVKFKYGTPVGGDAKVLEILEDRLKSVWNEQQIPAAQTAILLVGRGSSDPDANSTLFRIARLFWEKHKFQMVETAFMGITDPLMIDGLNRCRNLGAKNIIVLPYFLFTGVLIERMKKMVADYTITFPEINILLADYFGFHPFLEEIFERKIEEAGAGESNLNCDLCQYRLGAAHSHHQEHHPHHDHHQ